tara:strand:+ start:187 stop:444 length:258 start_codon:yes stop_codon:yes gene_type:complete
MKKIKEEELKTIQDQQARLTDIISRVGVLETQKHHLLHEIATVNEEIEQTKKQLEEEYGSININVVDGTYEEVEELEEDQPVAAI